MSRCLSAFGGRSAHPAENSSRRCVMGPLQSMGWIKRFCFGLAFSAQAQRNLDDSIDEAGLKDGRSRAEPLATGSEYRQCSGAVRTLWIHHLCRRAAGQQRQVQGATRGGLVLCKSSESGLLRTESFKHRHIEIKLSPCRPAMTIAHGCSCANAKRSVSIHGRALVL